MLDVFIFNLLLDPLTSSPGRDMSDVSDNKELLDKSLETGVGIIGGGGGININERKTSLTKFCSSSSNLSWSLGQP